MMVGNNLNDDQLHTIVDKTIADADDDGDEKLSMLEFSKSFSEFDIGEMSISFVN